MKKSGYRPSSDFNFEFVAEVLCENSLHSGYLVNVISERSMPLTQMKAQGILCVVHIMHNNYVLNDAGSVISHRQVLIGEVIS